MPVLITGTAGFIGFHLPKLLLAEGVAVHGYEGMTDYYDADGYRPQTNLCDSKGKVCRLAPNL